MEAMAFTYSLPSLMTAPRGDGHHILVIPGFMTSDQSTGILRRYLDTLGYHSHPWNLGRNTGTQELQEAIFERFEEIVAKAGKPITLIGQSLGGIYARELAYVHPDKLRQIITLGSPFGSQGTDNTQSIVSRLFQYTSGMSQDEMRERLAERDIASPPSVPCTSVYSKSDGVVHWSTCVEHKSAQAENIEIIGSHCGMGINPTVLHVITDRLAQDPDNWQPFNRLHCPVRSLVYPKPMVKV
jgi:pimeloyl-ACP methyl ester carboxylesterase